MSPLRYVVSFPGNVHREFLVRMADLMGKAANSSEWRDVVLTNGGTITRPDLPRRVPPVWVKRAQGRLR